MKHIIEIIDNIANGSGKTNDKIRVLIMELFAKDLENPHVV